MAGRSERSDRPVSAEEKKKFLAEAEAATAEANLHKADTRERVAEAKQAEIDLRKAERKEQDELARDDYNYVYVFDDAVTDSSVKKCINQLNLWTRQKDKCEIEIQINSPGGAVIDGFALIDFIHDLRGKGHKIDTIALGYAASMGGVLLQCGEKRSMGYNAFLLIHEAQFGAVGSFGKVEDQVKFAKILQERILDLFARRAQTVNPRTTKAFIRRKWERKDWWMNADEALKLGFIDEVRSAQ